VIPGGHHQEMASTRFDVQFKAQSCCRFTGIMPAVSSISKSPLFRGHGPYVPLQGENSPSFLCRVKADAGGIPKPRMSIGNKSCILGTSPPTHGLYPEVNVIMN